MDRWIFVFWKDYLVNATIYGVDRIDKPSRLEGVDGITYCRLDCTDKRSLDDKFKGIEFDIIIDDASHKLVQQKASFEILYPKLKSGGTYVIEDADVDNMNIFKAMNKGAELYDMRELRKGNNRTGRLNNLVVYKKGMHG